MFNQQYSPKKAQVDCTCTLHTTIEGKIEGKRGRGRIRQQMIDDIMEQEKYDNIKRTAEDRTR